MKYLNISENFALYSYIFLISLAGLFIGFLIEKFVLKKIAKYTLKTNWKYDDIIVYSLRGLIIIWLTLISFSIASNYFLINETVKSLLNKIVFSAFVLSFSIFVGRVFVGLINSKTSATPGLLPSTSIIANITRVIVFIIGALVILQTLGISITPVLTALGVGGLAVALALQETLSNLFAGIQVIASQQVRAGDYIKLDTGEEGYITDITWRNTTIRALPNNLIIVPNSKLASAIIRNFQLPDTEVSFSIDVGVSYDSDLIKVEEITVQTAKDVLLKTEGGVKNFEPFIRYHTFADSSINFTVILRAKEFVNQYLLKHEFVKALHQSFKNNNIEIPFPIRTVHLKEKSA